MLSKLSTITAPIADYLSRLACTASDLQTLAILLAFGILVVLETRYPKRSCPVKTRRQSYLTNLGTFIFNDTLMALLSVSSLVLLAEHYANLGLLSSIESPVAKALVSFILLDLTLYLWHRANHQFDWLWQFHKVHHSDRSMNVSTAFRLHFIEVLLTTWVKAAFVVVTGVDTAILLVNEALITLHVMFHHTNISFRGERWLGRLLVVPALHRTHHSTRRQEHDNNYGAVFSCWDRLFATYTEVEPGDIGLNNVAGQSFLELLKFGLTPAGTPNPQSVQAMIAEAAYYKAEKRGFIPGHEALDWLEAEREIRGRTKPQARY